MTKSLCDRRGCGKEITGKDFFGVISEVEHYDDHEIHEATEEVVADLCERCKEEYKEMIEVFLIKDFVKKDF